MAHRASPIVVAALVFASGCGDTSVARTPDLANAKKDGATAPAPFPGPGPATAKASGPPVGFEGLGLAADARKGCAIPAPGEIKRVGPGPSVGQVMSGDHCFVVYTRPNGEVHEVKADGTGDRKLLEGGVPPERVLVSHDGMKLSLCDAKRCVLHSFGGADVTLFESRGVSAGAFSADDKRVVAAATQTEGVLIYDGPAGGPFRKLFDSELPFIATTADGGFIALEAERQAGELFKLPVDGGKPRRIAEHVAVPPVSVAGGILFVDGAKTVQGHTIGHARFLSGEGKPVDLKLNAEPGYGLYPSPDARRVAALEAVPQPAKEKAPRRLFRLAVATRGGKTIELSKDAMQQVPRWSADGSRLLYAAACDVKANDCEFTVKDFATDKTFTLGRGDYQVPMLLSGDGRWAVVARERRVYAVDGDKRVIHEGKGANYANSGTTRDGKRLFWIEKGADGKERVDVLDVDTGAVTADDGAGAPNLGTSFLGEGPHSILFGQRLGAEGFRLRAYVVPQHRFVELADNFGVAPLDLTPDGGAGVYATGATGTELYVVGLP